MGTYLGMISPFLKSLSSIKDNPFRLDFTATLTVYHIENISMKTFQNVSFCLTRNSSRVQNNLTVSKCWLLLSLLNHSGWLSCMSDWTNQSVWGVAICVWSHNAVCTSVQLMFSDTKKNTWEFTHTRHLFYKDMPHSYPVRLTQYWI